jgi:hypothetical protein
MSACCNFSAYWRRNFAPNSCHLTRQSMWKEITYKLLETLTDGSADPTLYCAPASAPDRPKKSLSLSSRHQVNLYGKQELQGGSVGSGRGVYGKEHPRTAYAVGLQSAPARFVRGYSRPITIMRFRSANIRVINVINVINHRENRPDRDLRYFLSENQEKEKQLIVVDGSFHIRGSELRLRHKPRSFNGALAPAKRFACVFSLSSRKSEATSNHLYGVAIRSHSSPKASYPIGYFALFQARAAHAS